MVDNTAVTYIPIEFVGGPRDGQRIMHLAPPPVVICIPMLPLSAQVTNKPLALPSASEYIRIGEYRPRDEQTYQRVVVDQMSIARSEGVVLDILLAKADAPYLYDWCGE